NSRRGFTLVEVIVVLVILAILAAIAIPALTGYIDKANEKAVISQTRTAVVAAQTIVSDAHGNGIRVTTGGVYKYVTEGSIRKLTADSSISKVDKIVISGSSIYQLRVIATSNKIGYFLKGAYDTTTPSTFDITKP
ncbi:MAG: prepilin-type N-terminal cleavage/methylation domain-containing protein, partial [Clostridiales Family XIII bacterium]|nr:prepilin-type N-terminal cleavage/methylation domain-containing protein [Clostridiales Family XIII bacterium]